MHTIHEDVTDGLFTVGYFKPDGEWAALGDYVSFNEAAAICSWLNGGLIPDLSRKLYDELKIGGALRSSFNVAGSVTGRIPNE